MKKFGNLVLSKEQPVFFDRTSAYNNYLKDITNTPPLTYEQETELIVRYKKGDISARDDLMKANLRFVVSVAKEFVGYNSDKSIDILDIIQTGNIGLLKAIAEFEPSKGNRLISYAIYYIRGSIYNMINYEINKRDALHNKIKREIDINFKQTGANITVDQIVEKFGITKERAERNMRNIVSNPVILHEVLEDFEKIPGYIDTYTSATIKNFSENFYSDLDPGDILVKESLSTDIEHILESLTPREADVIRLCFGLGHQIPMTFEEIAETFDLTVERVRQIKEKALRRMKHRSRSKVIKGYLGYQKSYNQDMDINVKKSLKLTDLSGKEFYIDENLIRTCTWKFQVRLSKQFGKRNLEIFFNKNWGKGSFQKRRDMHYSDDLIDVVNNIQE